MAKLEPTAQYGDWTGAIAADGAAHDDVHALFRAKGLGTGQLVAWNLYVSDIVKPALTGFFVDAPDYEAVEALIQSSDAVAVNTADIELTAEQFFGLFKRFGAVGFKRGLALQGIDLEGWEG